MPDGDGDDPPAKVVVAETCTAYFSASGSSPTGSADNYLGFAATINTGSGYKNGTSSGTRYQLLAGGQTVSLTASPSSSASATNGMLYATMSYQSSAAPLEVILSGGIGPKTAKRFLIGQQVTAYLQTGGLSASYVHWSIVGGKPFSNYVVGDRAVYDNSNPPQFQYNVPDGYGLFVPLGENLTDLTIFYHYAMPESSTVACAAHLDVPVGAKPESGLDVAPVRTCSVEAPAFNLQGVIGSAVVNQPGGPNPGLYLGGASYSGNGLALLGSGTYWIGWVQAPGDFLADYGTGNWQFTQTIVPQINMTLNGVPYSWSLNGITQIDWHFDYDLQTHPGDADWQSANDHPGIPIVGGCTMLHDAMNCMAYMMYMPGGQGSCFVPLQALHWSWGATATPSAGGVWSKDGDGSPTMNLTAMFPDHPQWVRNASENQWVTP